MQYEIVKIAELKQITIYSICGLFEDGSLRLSEYRDFRDRMSNSSKKNLTQLNELKRIITIMDSSPNGDYFRREGSAHAMPSHSFKFRDSDETEGDFGLRLYCISVSPTVLILLNGDRKTTQNPNKCPNCSRHFTLADTIAVDFLEALNVRKEISIEGREITFEDGFYLND